MQRECRDPIPKGLVQSQVGNCVSTAFPDSEEKKTIVRNRVENDEFNNNLLELSHLVRTNEKTNTNPQKEGYDTPTALLRADFEEETKLKNQYLEELLRCKKEFSACFREKELLNRLLTEANNTISKLTKHSDCFNEKSIEGKAEKKAQCDIEEKELENIQLRTQNQELEVLAKKYLKEKTLDGEELCLQRKKFEEKITSLEQENRLQGKKLSDALDKVAKQSQEFLHLEERVKTYHFEKLSLEETIEKLKAEVVKMTEQLSTVVSDGEKWKADFTLTKEHLTSVLVELKHEREKNQKELLNRNEESEHLTIDLRNKLLECEKKYHLLFESHQSLRSVIAAGEKRLLLLGEKGDRTEVYNCFLIEVANTMQEIVHFSRRCILERDAIISRNADKLNEIQSEVNVLKIEAASLYEMSLNKDTVIAKQANLNASLEKDLEQLLKKKEEITISLSQYEADNEFLKNQVRSLTEELNGIDAHIFGQLSEIQEVNEKIKRENKILSKELEDVTKQSNTVRCELSSLQSTLRKDQEAKAAILKALHVAEEELKTLKCKESSLLHKIQEVSFKLTEEEKKNKDALIEREKLGADLESLRHQLKLSADKYNSILDRKHKEIDSLREKLKKNVELLKSQELTMCETNCALEKYENVVTDLRDKSTSLRMISLQHVESLKKCEIEMETKDKEISRLREKCKLLEEECTGKEALASNVSEKMSTIISLCSSQEEELQQLRQENLRLRNTLSMFVSTAQPKTETIFTERLNLAEGPLRHPKKRIENKQ